MWLLRPDAGSVEVAGEDVWSDPVAAKTRLGMVPDAPAMFTRLTGRELIEFNGLLRGHGSVGCHPTRREFARVARSH